MAKSWITAVARSMREPLAAHGFTARGRRFHRLFGSGDIAAVELRKSVIPDDDDGEHFYVLFGLVPGPWWDFIRGGVEGTTLDELGRPRPEAGIWSDSVKPLHDQPWVAGDASSAVRTASLVVQQLERTILPDLIRYSEDRRAVLNELAAPLRPILEIAFAAEAGAGDELERLLGQHLAAALTGDRAQQRRSLAFAHWARDYAARKAPGTHVVNRDD